MPTARFSNGPRLGGGTPLARLTRVCPSCALTLLLVLSFSLHLHAKKGETKDKEKAPEVIASVPSGFYSSPQTVSLRFQNAASGDSLRFTLDGQTPQVTSALYQSPIAITNTTLLRWRAFHGSTPGSLGSSHYTLLDPGVESFSSSLPVVILDTCGLEPNRDVKHLAFLQLLGQSGQRTTLKNTASENAGMVMVNIRGRASLRYPKRSFTVKLIDDEGEDRAAALEGMPKDEDWVLYAPYPDKTLMRDMLAYEMSRTMGHWAPRTQFVEVFVTDGKQTLQAADYVGVYVLEERIKRHPQRVNIQKLKPWDAVEPAISGGYILKKDHVDRNYFGPPDLLGGPNFASSGNKPGFPTPPGGFPGDPKGFLPVYTGPRENSDSSGSNRRSSGNPKSMQFSLTGPVPNNAVGGGTIRRVFRGDDEEEISQKLEQGLLTKRGTNQFYFVDPEEDEISPVQKNWLQRRLDQIETVLHGDAFSSPSQGYAALIDTRSFIDYHLMVEISKNVDGHRFSTFYTLDRGGKIKMEPLWDWNLSFGNSNGKQGWLSEHWLWPQLSDTEYTWFRRLFEDPDFGQSYVDRWAELHRSPFSTETLLKRIDEIAQSLGEAQKRNFERWPILGKLVTPNYFYGETYEEEVDLMKEWLRKRLEWINAQFVSSPVLNLADKGNAPWALTASDPSREILFTLDGSDPRQPGGSPNPKAIKLGASASVPPGCKIVARCREGQRWSAPTRL